jgi:hypothetical protein
MAPSTLLLAGGRRVVGVGPAAIAVVATPFQWTMALSPGAAEVPAGPNARTAISPSIVARPVVNLFLIRSSPLR